MSLRLVAASVIACVSLVTAGATLGAADEPVHDRQLNQWIYFGGIRIMVDSIQSVASPDGNKIISDGQVSADKGYLIITMDAQNPSSTDDIGIPSLNFSFELADGSQMENTGTFGPYVGAAQSPAPDPLHPKQHVKVRYVVADWPHIDITKMFITYGGGGDLNNAGDKNDRFQIKKGDVQVLAPVPTPTPAE